MRRFRTGMAAIGLIAAPLAATPVAAQETDVAEALPADELAEAQAIINAIYPPGERDAIFTKMVNDIGGQFGAAAMQGPIFQEPGIRAIMDDFLSNLGERLMPTIQKHLPQIIDATAVAYVNKFSLEELQQIRAFSQTPAGSRYFRESPELLSDPAVAAANQRYFADITKLQGEAGSEIRVKVQQYLAENPDALKRIEEAMAEAN
ncbi:DUF2059 domain-containing protein [Erythrobacter sp. W53]|uniref:DUF2059 domain-containing protein n=1 Tax=Erythrobacter sp. W53 TaxID=3425947 RepID=UPI003D76A296